MTNDICFLLSCTPIFRPYNLPGNLEIVICACFEYVDCVINLLSSTNCNSTDRWRYLFDCCSFFCFIPIHFIFPNVNITSLIQNLSFCRGCLQVFVKHCSECKCQRRWMQKYSSLHFLMVMSLQRVLLALRGIQQSVTDETVKVRVEQALREFQE